MILSDFDLKSYISSGRLIVKPFSEEIIRENGLDLRLGRTYAKLKRSNKVLDTKNPYDIGEYYEKRDYKKL